MAVLVLGAVLAMLALGFHASMEALDLKLECVTIGVKGLTRSLKVLHLTDLHLRGLGVKELRVLELVDELRPDLVVLTGDYVESELGLKYLEHFIKELRRRAPQTPVVAVLGNWECKTKLGGRVKEVLESAGVLVLRNSAATVEVRGEKILVVGLDDMLCGSPDLGVVAEACSAGIPVIVLAHEPALALQALKLCPGAVGFAGHCHCGQLATPLLLLPAGCPQQAYKGVVKGANSTLVISCGVGETILPVRLGSRPDLYLVLLKPDLG